MKIWINGRIFPEKDAKISVFDRGFLYGDGVFETMRSYGGIVFKANEHIDRLSIAMKAIKIRPTFSKGWLKRSLCKMLELNHLKDAYIRVSVTRGQGRFGISRKDKFIPNVVIITKKFLGYPDWMHKKGISARVVHTAHNEQSVISGKKTANFLNYIMARFEAKERGSDEAILLNTKGHVTEASTSNIFLVKRGVLHTPALSSGALPGITRGVVMGLARRAGIEVNEKKISRRELIDADEIFLTNSLAEILPVAYIDSRKIGSGRPGRLTVSMRLSYRAHVRTLQLT